VSAHRIDPLDIWIEEQMKLRGFLRHGERSGHWRSAGWSGHNFEFRHRQVRQWLEAAWAADDIDACKKKLASEIDALIAGKREGGEKPPIGIGEKL
jgi:hypothetical protein